MKKWILRIIVILIVIYIFYKLNQLDVVIQQTAFAEEQQRDDEYTRYAKWQKEQNDVALTLFLVGWFIVILGSVKKVGSWTCNW